MARKQAVLVAVSVLQLVVLASGRSWAAPGAFSTTSPLNGGCAGATPTFTWQASTGAMGRDGLSAMLA